MYLASPDLGQVTKFKPKMQDFIPNTCFGLDKRRDFFNWLSNPKSFVLLNGFENMQNVIQMALK